MKKHIELIFSIIIITFTIYFVLDTLVIEETYQKVEDTNSIISNTSIVDNKEILANDSVYSDDNMIITLKEYYENNTKIYVADVQINDSSLLKIAFAKSSYGKNITEKTSVIAERVNAVLAINGDYYGVQEKNNAISVTKNEEVGKAMASNPRTVIGVLGNNHYVFVVSDGRTNESEGLSLYELAEFMQKFGCITAYNLDGGGSSTMYFNGKVVNNPTTNGNRISERSVSDIVYVGY